MAMFENAVFNECLVHEWIKDDGDSSDVFDQFFIPRSSIVPNSDLLHDW